MSNGSATLPFVIPTGAERSGGICSAPLGPPKSSLLNPNPQTEVSSRPKRSEVEGPAVPPSKQITQSLCRPLHLIPCAKASHPITDHPPPLLRRHRQQRCHGAISTLGRIGIHDTRLIACN